MGSRFIHDNKTGRERGETSACIFENEITRGKCHDNTTRFHDLAEMCMQEFKTRLAPQDIYPLWRLSETD